MPRIDAIDISHWNSVSSFTTLKQAGVVGVFQKATEGTGYVDPTYAPRMGQALDAGLHWGAYHFLKHGSVQKQMEWFVKNAKLPPGSRAAIDYEDAACTLTDLQQSLDALSKLDPTMQICVYAGGLLKGQVGNSSYPWLAKYPLWLAQYTSGTPSWPTQIWPHYTLWQYTDKGTVPGVSGACDLNQFNGTPENCAKWFGPAAPAPPGPPPPPPPTPVTDQVVLAVHVPDGIKVAVVVNNQVVYGKIEDMPLLKSSMQAGGEE